MTRKQEDRIHKSQFIGKIIQTSDRVAPPTMNTNSRWPIFLKSLEACLSTESLHADKKI